ncbi:MAG: hypothetical protein QHJ34_06685 [bacterium]|jgi:translation initiation factor 2B subunit (eIF-2B alpha/beta/delta family)|nr:translation initiation factor eIF-2B [candidate division KSB1 bacterium]MDH7559903.1 hypothetical protein [bacterium]
MTKALRILQKIREDHVSGASVLAAKAAACFLAFLDERRQVPPARVMEGLIDLGCALLAAQPGNGPIFNLVNSLLLRLSGEVSEGEDSTELLRVARGHVNSWLQVSHVALCEIAAAAGALIKDGDIVLTHSYSSSVLAGLKQAKAADRRFKAIVTESRPLLEGRLLAKELAALGLPVTLLVDAAAPALVADVNLVLVGADMVTEHFIVNKIGTRAIAVAAQQVEVPVFAVSELSKCLPRAHAGGFQAERHPRQVWARAPRRVEVRNINFEAVPLELVTGVVTEQGVMRPADMRLYVEEELASGGIAPCLVQGE